MRLLIIGDNINEINGVPNYTRPLFNGLKALNIDVCYLYASSQQQNYSFFKRSRIEEVSTNIYEFKNCPVLTSNYNEPLKDVYNKELEQEFLRFIDKHKFSVVHIHSMVGFTSSIYRLIKSKGIKLFVTVHEYWWLCPYRVMVDFNRRICDGPYDFNKCAFCTDQKPRLRTDSMRILQMKIKHDFPSLMKFMVNIKSLLVKKNSAKKQKAADILAFGTDSYPKGYNDHKAKEFEMRLKENISALNICDKVICVSSDVKRILVEYGVNPNKLLVQHIGSVIAEKKVLHTKLVEEKNITFGFIGGVGYYKGVHQLIKAYTELPFDLKKKSNIRIYGGYSEAYVNAIRKNWLQNEDRDRVVFYGRFRPEDIPQISNTIDISVLPSLCADTAPQTIFESFSTGLPIIAPRIGGFPDFISDGINGLIYEAANVDSLREKLQYIIENPNMISLFQRNIPQNKTMKANIQELLALYEI